MVPIFFKTKDEVMWFAISKIGEKYLAFPKHYFENGKKIKGKSYSQWFVDVPQQLENYYTYVDGIGESAFLIAREDIAEFYDPSSRAQNINEGVSEKNEHIEAIQRLLLDIQMFFHIPISDIGIDGSSLLGDYKESSDIDILIYGVQNGDILKENFRNFGRRKNIELFSENDGFNNSDIPQTVYTTGFGQKKEQAVKQFLRRYYGRISNKRFSIVCVPKENELGYISLDRKLMKKGEFEKEVLIVEDTYSSIVPTIYKIVDDTGNRYSLEIFNHYGINQAHVGERFFLRGPIYEEETKVQFIIISFWTSQTQTFSIVTRDKKQEVLDRLKMILFQEDEEKNKKIILSMMKEISSQYSSIGKTEVISRISNSYNTSHGIITFCLTPSALLNEIVKKKKVLKKICQNRGGLNFYCLRIPKCGKLQEEKEERHLDYITIVTFEKNNELIAILPTDKLELKAKDRGMHFEVVDR